MMVFRSTEPVAKILSCMGLAPCFILTASIAAASSSTVSFFLHFINEKCLVKNFVKENNSLILFFTFIKFC